LLKPNNLANSPYLTAVVYLALGEGERLSGALDHSLARGWFRLFHFNFLPDG